MGRVLHKIHMVGSTARRTPSHVSKTYKNSLQLCESDFLNFKYHLNLGEYNNDTRRSRPNARYSNPVLSPPQAI
jgi:hypothetical protein